MDENSTLDGGAFDGIDLLIDETKATLIMVHHFKTRGKKDESSMHQLCGSNALAETWIHLLAYNKDNINFQAHFTLRGHPPLQEDLKVKRKNNLFSIDNPFAA